MPIITCPICQREVEALRHTDDASLETLIEVNVPNWQPDDRLCPACYDLFHQANRRRQTSDKIFHDGAYDILPTPKRVGANEKFTGRGVTIAFLDSGFFPHDDLIKPQNRIKHYVNIANENAPADEYFKPDISSWHGMMTSVVACGNGYLSGGNYRGIASDADVVLVKLARTGRITDQNIEDGQYDQADAVRVGVAVDLVDHEQAERHERCGIGPELAAQQADDQQKLHGAMTDQIEGVEILGADGERLQGTDQCAGNEIIRVLDDFVLGEQADQTMDEIVADDQQQQTAQAFDHRMGALQQHAHLEDPMYAALVHAGPIAM